MLNDYEILWSVPGIFVCLSEIIKCSQINKESLKYTYYSITCYYLNALCLFLV